VSGKQKKKPKGSGYINHGTVTVNRRAKYDYAISETIEAGMILTGSEVKALRIGRVSLNEAFAGEKDGALFLQGASIGIWEGANRTQHEEKRPRKLLVKKREMQRLLGLVSAKGMTLVPMKVYFNERGYAKVLLGVAKGKKLYDKRETEKQRDWQREKSRIMKEAK
jgi:SsrA-binding protein